MVAQDRITCCQLRFPVADFPRVLKRLLQSFAQRARATCAQWISKQQFTKHTEMLQSTPTLQNSHASLLLRLPSAKECGRLAMDRSDSTLEVCCHLGIATKHAIYACSFATALCRLCYRASYKMREACEQIFPSSLFGKTDMRLRLRLLVCVIMLMIMLHFTSVLT